MKKDKQLKRAYQFFIAAEKNQSTFTLNDVATASGWSRSTVSAYRSKKWHFFIKEAPGGLQCDGILDITEDAFIRIHAQKASIVNELFKPQYSPSIDALIDKSRESALLAIQIFNNPLVKFRAPGFIVNIVIAYTSLFHAIFERNGVGYWYKNNNDMPILIDGDYKYWELQACVTNYFKGQITPETENLNLLIKLRNKIEHRFIPALDFSMSGYFQSALLNFEKVIVKEFGHYFALGQNHLALALQLSEYSSQQQEVLKKIQSEHYDDVREYIDKFRETLPDEILISSNFCFRAFLVPILGNHAKSSDIAIEFIKYDPDNPEEMQKYEKEVAFIKQKTVQVADQGKLKPKHVIERVQVATGLDFRMQHHTNAWKYYGVRTSELSPDACNIKYCQFNPTFNSFIYTEAWVEFLCEKLKDLEEFERIKKYRPQ